MTEEQLVKWIDKLMQEHRLYSFYNSSAWRKVRAEIMHKHHNECYMCRQKGKITKADTVHHVHHVSSHPQYALSEYVIKDGERVMNLMPLCNSCHWTCHPEKHDKARRQNKKKPDVTEERW